MPLKGRQRSKLQKAATAALQQKRWSTKPPIYPLTLDPETLRHLQELQEEHERLMERKREIERHEREAQRLRGLITDIQRQERERKKTKERHERRIERYRKECKSLEDEIARLDAHDRRMPSRIQHAVQEALKRSSDPEWVGVPH
ncbi:hypothetical protein BJ322DRAFT_1106672 [Thelephora terrestris]|uniref:Uncharacterized protein n=1 Tax=Thelephora terrestris TaxID=56493 RepID=A0A9P6HJT6_9AGAM|nr:hypothetical protein BJ322DRAFT_1106672 [Thelephora terrestris]